MPTASFAGQQDSYLNITGQASILEHVRKCWASLFTDRAVTYRLQQGITHDRVHMAVVVQKMVHAETSGVMFTADPITGHHKVIAISDPLIKDALVTLLTRGDFLTLQEASEADSNPQAQQAAQQVSKYQTLQDYDPALVSELIHLRQASLTTLQAQIQQQAGVALFDFIQADLAQLQQELSEPRSMGVTAQKGMWKSYNALKLTLGFSLETLHPKLLRPTIGTDHGNRRPACLSIYSDSPVTGAHGKIFGRRH